MTARSSELTGRKVLIIALSAFAVIITANMAMLFAATGSFPGLVVKNSYVASQGWNDRASAQRATGWQIATGYDAGRLSVVIDSAEGMAVTGLAVTALIGRPATDVEDRAVTLSAAEGRYLAPVDLAPGAWRVEITATRAGSAPVRATGAIFVTGE